jgi:hypothetical protein
MPQTKNIYICGDSFSQTDPNYQNQHWSELLENKIHQYNKDYKIINLAAGGSSNLAISFQVDQALTDKNLAFCIVNFSDIYRIDIQRNQIDLVNSRFSPLSELLLKSPIKKLINVDKMYQYYINNKPSEKQKICFESVDFIYFKQHMQSTSTNVENVDQYVSYFYQTLWDLNLQFYQNLKIIKSTLGDLQKIPFIWNEGGMLYVLIKELSIKISQNYKFSELDLLHYCPTNIWTYEVVESNRPSFHTKNYADHLEISEIYFKHFLSAIKN